MNVENNGGTLLGRYRIFVRLGGGGLLLTLNIACNNFGSKTDKHCQIFRLFSSIHTDIDIDINLSYSYTYLALPRLDTVWYLLFHAL